jgi:two-component system response regulator NreC
MENKTQIKILLADDHNMVREGFRSLIEKAADMQVVAEANNGRMAVLQAKEHMPNIIIMDIAMPELNGIEATRQILGQMPSIKVIALSMHSDRRFVLRMLEVGASGYLTKEDTSKELFEALRTVLTGKMYLSPSIAGIVVDQATGHSPRRMSHSGMELTPREREVLQLLAEGRSTKHIASHLSVSVRTVETHRRRLMEKLDIHSLSGLTKYAVREGLTSLD